MLANLVNTAALLRRARGPRGRHLDDLEQARARLVWFWSRVRVVIHAATLRAGRAGREAFAFNDLEQARAARVSALVYA